MPSDRYLSCMALIKRLPFAAVLLFGKFWDLQPLDPEHTCVSATVQAIPTACLVQAVGASLCKHQGMM